MASFATVADIRLRFGLEDGPAAPDALLEASLAEAHAEICRRLDPARGVDADAPPPMVVAGETWLAGACLLRALAGRDAVERRSVTIAGHRLDTGARFNTLAAMAALAERQAWDLLAPYLRRRPASCPADVTAPEPVLGEA